MSCALIRDRQQDFVLTAFFGIFQGYGKRLLLTKTYTEETWQHSCWQSGDIFFPIGVTYTYLLNMREYG